MAALAVRFAFRAAIAVYFFLASRQIAA